MKQFIESIVRRITKAASSTRLALLGLTAAAVMASGGLATADQQGFPNTILPLTNQPAALLPGQVVLWTTNYIPLRRTGLGLTVQFTSSNLVTAPLTVFGYPSVDGTNAWLIPFFTLQVPANGTNLAIGGTNFSRYSLEGMQGMYLTVSNSSLATNLWNTIQTNWVTGNTNIPGGLWFNRPNQ